MKSCSSMKISLHLQCGRVSQRQRQITRWNSDPVLKWIYKGYDVRLWTASILSSLGGHYEDYCLLEVTPFSLVDRYRYFEGTSAFVISAEGGVRHLVAAKRP